eukprot:1376209-Lingulodinium_polyedra.AAC.1
MDPRGVCVGQCGRLTSLVDRAFSPPPGGYPGATQPEWFSVWARACEMRPAKLMLGLERSTWQWP